MIDRRTFQSTDSASKQIIRDSREIDSRTTPGNHASSKQFGRPVSLGRLGFMFASYILSTKET
jgi:hypothetical protein